MMEGNNTHAINHQASYGLYYRPRNRSDYILEDDDAQPDPTKNKILGVNAKVEIRKSSTDNTGYTIEVPIKRGRVGNAIWNEKEVVDLAVAFGIVYKENKSWFAFDPTIVKDAKAANIELKEKINGMANLYEYFETEKEPYTWVKKKVEEIIRLRSTLIEEDEKENETPKHKEKAGK
jgi:hypothetical protein